MKDKLGKKCTGMASSGVMPLYTNGQLLFLFKHINGAFRYNFFASIFLIAITILGVDKYMDVKNRLCNEKYDLHGRKNPKYYTALQYFSLLYV